MKMLFLFVQTEACCMKPIIRFYGMSVLIGSAG